MMFVILDNFVNARRSVPERLAQITGQPVTVIEGDVRDAETGWRRFLADHEIGSVVHFAALKAVGESMVPATWIISMSTSPG